MASIHATPDEHDPRHHMAKIEDMLNNVVAHAREDVSKIDDPHARALFETTPEVLAGPRQGVRAFRSAHGSGVALILRDRAVRYVCT